MAFSVFCVQAQARKNAKAVDSPRGKVANPAMVAMAAGRFKKGISSKNSGAKPRSALGKRSENTATASA
jgi:hypothetical protein